MVFSSMPAPRAVWTKRGIDDLITEFVGCHAIDADEIFVSFVSFVAMQSSNQVRY